LSCFPRQENRTLIVDGHRAFDRALQVFRSADARGIPREDDKSIEIARRVEKLLAFLLPRNVRLNNACNIAEVASADGIMRIGNDDLGSLAGKAPGCFRSQTTRAARQDDLPAG